jgi:hypothetical protein
MFAIEYDYRSDNGPTLVGPFADREEARQWHDRQSIADAELSIRPLASPIEGASR